MILDGCLHRMMALAALREDAAARAIPRISKRRSPSSSTSSTDRTLNERARAALQKNLELKRRLLASFAEVGGTMKALATELDSMASLLEVLHQNSISMRDPQAISEELDTIVRQSEDSERVVREMEALLRSRQRRVERRCRDAGRPACGPKVPPDPDAAAAESEGAVSTPSRHYPRWARTLAHGIRARLGNTFVLHGNTHDLVAAAAGRPPASDASSFVPLTAFLAEWIFGQRDVVIEYQRANGADLPHPRVAQALHRRGGGGRRGPRHRPGAVAAARSGGVLLAARLVPQAGRPPRRRRSASPILLPVRRDADSRVGRRSRAPKIAPCACSSRSGRPIRRCWPRTSRSCS